MMTSVTLPSTSGPIHGIYPTLAEPEESITAEAELSAPARVPKRRLGQLSSSAAVAESCKKRRKQSTPVRISAAELSIEGKQPPPSSPSPTPPPSEHRCPVCQLYLPDGDQLQGHLAVDHCKREPEEETQLMEMTGGASQPWLGEMSGKEAWPMGLGLPPFPPAPSGMFMSLPQFAHQTTDTIARQPIRIFNPDAYCDLCNKEFCNKYFLKTHKANKHGIYSDPPSSSEQAGSSSMATAVQIPSYSANIKLPTSVPSVEIPAIKTEPPVAAGSSIISPFSEIFQSPFTNKLFSKLNKAALPCLYETEQCENVPTSNGFSSNNSESDKAIVDDQPIEERSSPKNLTNIQAEPTSLIKNEPDVNVLYTSPSKMSPGQRELDYSNRLRRIGVMNPKAFCEICCKEYCNKYFLRTHKMKRHGIYIPDEKDKEYKSSESSSNFSWAHNTQTSPLNLIMTEQSDRKTTSPADISCDMCGIRFQNASLAQLHNVNVHAKPFTRKLDTMDNTSLEEPKKGDVDRPLNAEAISEDLQKLQTMILQLNDLDVSKVPTTCSSCNREFENRYFLHAHMMTEHGILLDDLTDAEKSGETENSANNNTLCDLCGKDVQNVEEMKKHMMESHAGHQPSSDNSKDDFNNGFSTPEKTPTRVPPASSAGSLPDRRISMSLTPTSSYCEICNKELCNKYFMKTHMQRMHGIEIENGAQIGGVICDICNKELCSKYFLRVHKHNTHGIVEYGTSLLQPRGKSDSEPPQGPQLTPETETALKPSDLADLSHRYFTHFTEVCSICSRRFRSTKWLKAHLLSDHGQMGAEKWAELEQQLQQTVGQHSKAGSKSERTSPTLRIPNGGQEGGGGTGKVGIQSVLSSLFGVDESSAKSYQCSFCPFSTPLLPLLFVHERSHNMQQTGEGGGSVEVPLKCPVCTQSFLQPELLQHHMFSQHTFLPLPPFFNGSGSGETAGPAEPEEEVSPRCGGEEPDGPGSGSGGRVTTPKPTSGINKLRKVTKGAKLRVVPANESEMGESLKDVAKKVQLPTTYAFPQEEQASLAAAAAAAAAGTAAGYVMQAFLLEESAAGQADRRVVPAVVFLPVLQKQPSPITLTFTLTPA